MKILSYNVRGLGSRTKRAEIKELGRKEQPDFWFLQETKLESFNDLVCRSIVGNQDASWAHKSAVGSSGGIATIWNQQKFVASSNWDFDGALVVKGSWVKSGTDCLLINIYSPCDLAEKLVLWDRLGIVMDQWQDLCICIFGDFNTIRSAAERVGRRSSSNGREIGLFNRFISDNDLIEYPLVARKFTWYRGDGTCKSRIDRCLCNTNWIRVFPNLFLKGGKRGFSDHCPLTLESKILDWGPKPFKSLDAWFEHPGFMDFIKDRWESYKIDGWGGYVLKEKLKCLRMDIKKWNKEVFGRLEERIASRKDEIFKLDIVDDAFGLESEEVIKRNRERALLIQDTKKWHSYLQQKAKVKWLNAGDANTAIFHRYINGRRRKNEIQGLNIDGTWSRDVQEIKDYTRNEFEDHFKSSGSRCFRISSELLDRKLTAEDNKMLTEPFSEEEVLTALKSCGENKSPGPDGFNPVFFRRSWEIVKKDVMRFLTEFHQNGRLTKGLNHAFITLIQKKETACEIKDFRPISLIGGPYKILSKILARRLSRVLENIISKEQSAFVNGRQILDCIAALNGVFENAKKGRCDGFCYKIDFAKAYDSIEWSFLVDMCRAFGFCEKWVSWLRACVESAHVDVLVNGSPSGDFKLGRGLRQGDPISPFLFILAAEGIGLMLKRAISLGMFKPMEVGPNKIRVSHIQFADDTLFLGKASITNALFLRRFLVLLEVVSGLRINEEKCQIVSIKAEPGIIEDMAAILRCKNEAAPFKYLGVNVGSRHRKTADWNYVIDKVRDRLCKWSNLKISLGGRITLIKSVLSSLPTYVLSVFRAPMSVIKKIISLQQRFLWGGGMRDKKLVWAKWDSLSVPKSWGGLGLRDLVCFNKALLGKWAWRALGDEESLWLDIVKGSVGSGSRGRLSGVNLLNSSLTARGWWGDVLVSLKDLRGDWFVSSVGRRVGNGETTLFWEDLWVGESKLCEIFKRLYDICLDKKCSVARAGGWVENKWLWGVGWRRELRAWELEESDKISELMQCRKLSSDESDRWMWKPEKEEKYSVKSAYKMLMIRKQAVTARRNKVCELIWGSMAPQKVKAVVWRIHGQRIATKSELNRRGVTHSNAGLECPLCRGSEETIEHLFFECSRSWAIWCCCLEWIGSKATLSNKVHEHLIQFCSLRKKKKRRTSLLGIWMCTAWIIWSKRNDVVFNNEEWNHDKIFGEIKYRTWCWETEWRKKSGSKITFSCWSLNPLTSE